MRSNVGVLDASLFSHLFLRFFSRLRATLEVEGAFSLTTLSPSQGVPLKRCLHYSRLKDKVNMTNVTSFI